jgi:hypothetical protein
MVRRTGGGASATEPEGREAAAEGSPRQPPRRPRSPAALYAEVRSRWGEEAERGGGGDGPSSSSRRGEDEMWGAREQSQRGGGGGGGGEEAVAEDGRGGEGAPHLGVPAVLPRARVGCSSHSREGDIPGAQGFNFSESQCGPDPSTGHVVCTGDFSESERLKPPVVFSFEN